MPSEAPDMQDFWEKGVCFNSVSREAFQHQALDQWSSSAVRIHSLVKGLVWEEGFSVVLALAVDFSLADDMQSKVFC